VIRRVMTSPHRTRRASRFAPSTARNACRTGPGVAKRAAFLPHASLLHPYQSLGRSRLRTSYTVSLLGLAMAACLVVTSSSARASLPPLEEVTEGARRLRLDADPEWLRLIHYKTGFFGTSRSEVTPGEFFLAPTGTMDPEAELVATLAAFLAPVVSGLEDEHALCRFPARRAWLESRLDLTRRGISIRCPALDDALGRVDATGVSLVYASTYLGNPASAFGHTFLHVRTGHGETSPRDQATRDREDLVQRFHGTDGFRFPCAGRHVPSWA